MARQLFLVATLLASQVAAHGYIKTFTLEGTEHEGFSASNPSPDPEAIGWSFTTPDEGAELDFGSPDFVCRQGAKPASNSGTVAAGGKATFLWTSDDKERNPDGWAKGHRGPILTYIAPCDGGDCANVDKSSLRWTKIAEAGLISGPANVNGVWATDKMRENGGINEATIPEAIAPGKYVIRNEIIALHRANIGEPEFYMQCGNIEITGSGSDDLSGSGTAAGELYSKSDSQLFNFDIYDSKDTEWPIPGPPLYNSGSPKSSPTPSPSPKESRQGKNDWFIRFRA
ncbi:glycoside hydrolase [Chaetomium sp. MPI-SDFR-AT-0129]|nr:glycoside hydrolase [Chaetomium sp. MPI-SDFR-AT-0129]